MSYRGLSDLSLGPWGDVLGAIARNEEHHTKESITDPEEPACLLTDGHCAWSGIPSVSTCPQLAPLGGWECGMVVVLGVRSLVDWLEYPCGPWQR